MTTQDSPELEPLAEAYELLGELCARDDARTFLARRRADAEPVLVVLPRVSQPDERNALTLFAADAKLLTGLEHPALVPVLEMRWLAHDVLAVVTERPDAPTLEELLERGESLPPARVAAILREVNALLEWARDEKVVHRTVEPASLFVEEGSERVRASFVVRPIPLSGAPGEEGDARTIAALAWAMLAATAEPRDAVEETLAERRPDLPDRVVVRTEALLAAKAGSVSSEDVRTYIAEVAMAEPIRAAELEAARIEAERLEELRAGRNELAAARAEHERAVADAEKRLTEERERLTRETAEERESLERSFAEQREELERTLERERAALAEERARLAAERERFERTVQRERAELAERRAELERDVAAARERFELERQELELQRAAFDAPTTAELAAVAPREPRQQATPVPSRTDEKATPVPSPADEEATPVRPPATVASDSEAPIPLVVTEAADSAGEPDETDRDADGGAQAPPPPNAPRGRQERGWWAFPAAAVALLVVIVGSAFGIGASTSRSARTTASGGEVARTPATLAAVSAGAAGQRTAAADSLARARADSARLAAARADSIRADSVRRDSIATAERRAAARRRRAKERADSIARAAAADSAARAGSPFDLPPDPRVASPAMPPVSAPQVRPLVTSPDSLVRRELTRRPRPDSTARPPAGSAAPQRPDSAPPADASESAAAPPLRSAP